jgi:hypothetical protein
MIDHLVDKGVEVSAISAYIRNLAHIMAANPQITLQELNERMRSLGWDDFRLDGYTLRLILANFETDCSGLTERMPPPMQIIDEKAEKKGNAKGCHYPCW